MDTDAGAFGPPSATDHDDVNVALAGWEELEVFRAAAVAQR
jgi:hypothetical protein